jgi:hypothetical protein
VAGRDSERCCLALNGMKVVFSLASVSGMWVWSKASWTVCCVTASFIEIGSLKDVLF